MGLFCALMPVNGAQGAPRFRTFPRLVSTAIPSRHLPTILCRRARCESGLWRSLLGMVQSANDAKSLSHRSAKGR